MTKKLTWKEKYELSLNEHVSIKGIMSLLDCGQPYAISIRNDALNYCAKNNIRLTSRCVPMDVVLELTNKDRTYFYNRYLEERKVSDDGCN